MPALVSARALRAPCSARGSGSFLSRATAILATLFFLTSLGLSYLFSQQTAPSSVVDRVQPAPTVPAPASLPPGLLPSVPVETSAGTAPAATQEPAAAPAEAPADKPAQ